MKMGYLASACVCFFAMLVSWSDSADVAYRTPTTNPVGLTLAVLTDNDNIRDVTCATFEGGSTSPPATDFSLPILNVDDAMEYTLKIEGKNTGCLPTDDSKLYVILVPESNRQNTLGRTERCLLTQATPGDRDTCTYVCSCHGDCNAIRFVRRPMAETFAPWTLCTVAPLVYVNCVVQCGRPDSRGQFTGEHLRLLHGSLTGINFNLDNGIISGVQTRFGSTFSAFHGHARGDHAYDQLAALDPGEVITSFTMYKGTYRTYQSVVGMAFSTDTGRNFGTYGKQTADVSTIVGTELMYLSGGTYGVVDGILAHFRGC